MLLAWYLAAARALQRSDDALLKALWQAALTCTITVHYTESFSKLALSAVAASEKYLRYADMTDTFFAWSTKVQGIMDDRNAGKKKLSSSVMAQHLADQGVRYRGTLIQKAHVLSVGHVHDMFDEPSWRILRKIEHEFGRSVLSTEYTKVRRFLAALMGVGFVRRGAYEAQRSTPSFETPPHTHTPLATPTPLLNMCKLAEI